MMLKVMFLLSCLVASGLCHYYGNSYEYRLGSILDGGFGNDNGLVGYGGLESGYGNNFGRGGYELEGYGYGGYVRGDGNRWMRRNSRFGGY